MPAPGKYNSALPKLYLAWYERLQTTDCTHCISTTSSGFNSFPLFKSISPPYGGNFLLMVLFVITIPVGLLMIIGFKRVLSSTDEEMSCISKYSSRREKYVQKRIVVRTVSFQTKKHMITNVEKEHLDAQEAREISGEGKEDENKENVLMFDKPRKQKNNTSTETRIFRIDVHQKKNSPSILETTSICAICWSTYVDGDTACCSRNKSCSHIFHEACLMPWLLKRNDCPMCRSDFLQKSS
mmetsp:Transcript_22843/g.25989  ORF Transcript_22843/g.25989 Transcript_22843/m.25989 type:complete len:240 (+) Transcript_22843:317-1036(+)